MSRENKIDKSEFVETRTKRIGGDTVQKKFIIDGKNFSTMKGFTMKWKEYLLLTWTGKSEEI